MSVTINRQFNRVEKGAKHSYIEEQGGNSDEHIHVGFIKCKLVHTRGKSLVIPDQIYLGNAKELKWIQPLSYIQTLVVFGLKEECSVALDISCRQTLTVKFTPSDFVREYNDCSHLYECRIQGPADLESYATGDAVMNSDNELFLRLYHHTAEATVKKIEASKAIWGSEWNIQGTTKKLVNVRYTYFTPLDKIINDADLNQIGMGGHPHGKIGLRRIDDTVLKLDVYRESSSNRQYSVIQWVNASHLASQHVMFYDDFFAYHTVVCPFIQRVGLRPGSVYSFNNGYYAGNESDIKRFYYIIIGDAGTDEGLLAPYDEENTSQIFKVECTKGRDFISFWQANANTDLFSGKAISMQEFNVTAPTIAIQSSNEQYRVERRAFAIWIVKGSSHGHDVEDWEEAKSCLPAEMEKQEFADMQTMKEKELGHWHQWHRDQNGGLTVVAPHGGYIEAHTSLIAQQIAGSQFNIFVFEGLIPDEDECFKRLHITSAKYREANLKSLQKKSYSTLSIHGKKDKVHGEEITWVGGQNKAFRESVTRALNAAKFLARDAVSENLVGYKGTEDDNFVNTYAKEKGVQLELSRSLREKLFNNQSALETYSQAIRDSFQPKK